MEDGNQSSRPFEANDTENNIAAEETLHESLPFSCSHCNQSFLNKVDLKKHIKCSHSEVIEKPHQCYACRIAFVYPCELKRHLKHAHNYDKPFNCPKCAFNCKSKSNLKQHLKTHEQNREKFKCSRCGMDYLTKCGLKTHWREAHVCLINEGDTKRNNPQDNNDEGLVHTPAAQQRYQPLPYPCQQCDRSFKSQLGLTVQITCQHPEVNKKPHKCHVCQKSFPTPSKLLCHSGQVHKEDWPYWCSKCTFHCKTEWVLKSHLKIHDKDWGILKCSICGKEYLSNKGLNNHLKTAHDSLSSKANTESNNSQDVGETKESQGEASGRIVEAALEHIPITTSQGFQNGLVTDDQPTLAPHPRSETTDNAVSIAWVCYCGSISFSEEDQNKHWQEMHKPDGAIDEAETATGNATGVTSQGDWFNFYSTQNKIFTSSNPIPGPSNAPCEASGGIAEASPEIITNAVSNAVQNDLVTVDHHPIAEAGCTESQKQFPYGEWDCHCGNMYASEDDLQRHLDEDHIPNHHLKTAHDSLSTDAHTQSGNSLDNGAEEKSQGEAREEIAEAAPANYLIDVSRSFESGIGTNGYPTPGLQPWTEPTENAVPLVGWVGYSGSNFFSHQYYEKQYVEENKPDDAIKEAETATKNADGETSRGVSFSFVYTQNGLFTSSNPTPGPSNGQREACSEIAEASPESISIAVNQGVQNGLSTVDHHPSTDAIWTEWETNENGFPFGEWGCHCGNMYASEDDLQRHWNEDHKPNDGIA